MQLSKQSEDGCGFDMKFRELEKRHEIIENSFVTIYSSAEMSRYDYPYRLAHPKSCPKWVTEQSHDLIVDSGINDPDITNKYVLDKAHEAEADKVIAKDYYQDIEATTESVLEFLDEYDDHPCNADVMIPLQPPYSESYAQLDWFDNYALGGIRYKSSEMQVNKLYEFRDAAGYDVDAHGLGIGANLTLIQAVQMNPELLDSLDMSSTDRMPINNTIADRSWERKPFQTPKGKNSSTMRAMYAITMLMQLNYMMGPFCDDPLIGGPFENRR